jgi:hypothetical protein
VLQNALRLDLCSLVAVLQVLLVAPRRAQTQPRSEWSLGAYHSLAGVLPNIHGSLPLKKNKTKADAEMMQHSCSAGAQQCWQC